MFAAVRGSVAAPTAGLHFTPQLLAALSRRGVERAEITLHVGYGTFKPVRAEHVEAARRRSRALRDPRRRPRRHRPRARRRPPRRRRRDDDDARARGRGAARPGTGRCRAAETRRSFIYPGYQFQVIDGLLTNFHLPRSSLLMLVAAFAGRERVLAAYREAVAQRYRFYSYGDAMLIT